MKHIKYAFITLSIFLSACVTEAEKEARRQNAFDLSGTWKTTPDSEVQFSLTLTNQNVKHDIFVTIARTSPLSDKEKTLLSKVATEHGIAVETLTNQAFPTAFGGEDAWLAEVLDGGENISKDVGKTSEFHICSDNPPQHASAKVEEGKTNIKVMIGYCLSGTVKKDTPNLIENGVLSLHISYIKPTTEKKAEDSTPSEEVTLSYKAEKSN